MKIHQLSIFIENEPGQLRYPCRRLAEEGIEVLTVSMADTKQFGILRLIVRDWERARRVLEEAGAVVKVNEVVAIEVADRVNGYARILDAVDEAGLSIEYMYAFPSGTDDRVVLIIRFEDVDAALRLLQRGGLNVVGSVELYERAKV